VHFVRRIAPGGSIRLWARLRTIGPVVPRDAHVPFPLRGDDGHTRGRGPLAWATVCSLTSLRRGVRIPLRGSSQWFATPLPVRHRIPSPTHMDLPILG
jgi:hypothetical protein